MFRYLVAILLVVVLAVPAFATCNWECGQSPVDTDGDGTPDATLWSCNNVTQGTLLECEVKVRCWRMAGAGRYCEPYCDGYSCYYI